MNKKIGQHGPTKRVNFKPPKLGLFRSEAWANREIMQKLGEFPLSQWKETL